MNSLEFRDDGWYLLDPSGERGPLREMTKGQGKELLKKYKNGQNCGNLGVGKSLGKFKNGREIKSIVFLDSCNQKLTFWPNWNCSECKTAITGKRRVNNTMCLKCKKRADHVREYAALILSTGFGANKENPSAS